MTLTRGARITGAALCALLALIVGAWIVRDLSTADEPLDLWRFWTGGVRGPDAAPLTTTVTDLALLAVYAGAAVAALRSAAAVAAAALTAVAVITLALRLPSLWVLTASWMDLQATDSLRTRALYSTFAVLGLAAALIVAVLAGRRPPGAEAYEDAHSPRADPGAARRLTPTRPARGASVLAFLLLFAAAGVTVAWQIRWAYLSGAAGYADLLTGSERAPLKLLQTPSAWLACATALLALTAAVGALNQAVFTRPFGAVVAAVLIADGAVGLDFTVRRELFRGFGELRMEEQLLVATWLFELVAGAVLLVVSARRGESGPADGVPGGYGAAGGTPRPGYGCPQAGYSGYGHPQPPGPPDGQGGGHGPPPPPSSPPPGW
ncbi:hypothetical protein ABZ208_31375 [Streptomyces sp. NPDC006208]|uniref:hypothetical protein n=1 Tax=Streptomyces sp. NPDC006208 TaxID=3156734 RepID=UPI0033B398BD